MMLFQSQFITIIAKSFITQLLFKSLIPIFVTNLKKKKKKQQQQQQFLRIFDL